MPSVSKDIASRFRLAPLVPWFDTAYKYKKRITVDHTKVSGGSDLTNFPLLVSFTDPNLRSTGNGGNVQNSSGFDIIFTDGTETTKLDHEIDSYSVTTGKVEMWVRLPTLSASVDTVIYLYYDNSAISTTQENVTGVWAAYNGVWHLKENPAGTAPQMKDSTSNLNHLTSNGTMLVGQQVAGQVDGSLSFDGSNDAISRATNATFLPSGDMTLSFWINFTQLPSTVAHDCMVVYKNHSVSPFFSYQLYIGAAANKVTMNWVNSGSTQGAIQGSAALSASTWYKVTVTKVGTTGKVYVNGVVGTASSSTFSGTIFVSDGTYSLGGVASKFSNALIDEVRLLPASVTDGWEATEYANQNAPGTFLTVDVSLPSTSRDIAARFRQRSADQLKDVAFRLRLAKFVDIATRFRQRSASQLKDVVSRLRLAKFVDVASRFRQRSADQLKDVASRLFLISPPQRRDTQARYRQMSALTAKDVATRLRLAKFVDVALRFRLRSANQLKDTASRLRLAKFVDVASRFRQRSANQLKDVATRLRLAKFVDISARFRQRSADTLRDVASRLVLAVAQQRSKDVSTRLRQRSADTLRDVASRLFLISPPQRRDVAARYRLLSSLQQRDVVTRVRLMSSNRVRDVLGRVRFRSADTLRDMASRLFLISQPQKRDMQARYRLSSAWQFKDIKSRFTQRSANQLRDVTLRLVLSLAQQRSKDVKSRFRTMAAPQKRNLASRLCLYERTPNADMRIRRGAARMRTRSGRAKLVLPS